MLLSNSGKNTQISQGEIKVLGQCIDTLIDRTKVFSINEINDLSALKTNNEEDLIKALSSMKHNKQFFKYCSSMLININPGPDYISEYLNLQTWLQQIDNVPIKKWPPHLYSFICFIFQAIFLKKKSQAVLFLGQVGSGKTFSLIHMIECICHVQNPYMNNNPNEQFDIIQKSIQLVNILGSVFRQNNLESSCCGMTYKLGFNENKSLVYFNINAMLLDYTLPFSETGRSFTLLHSLMAGASDDLKKKLNLPLKDDKLSFFNKYNKSFSKKVKEQFRINDLEIWNRFHFLLKTFKFTKQEIIDILHVISFIINLNDIKVSNTKSPKTDKILYRLIFDSLSKSLMKSIGIKEKEFFQSTGSFSSPKETQKYIKGLMKYSYYIVFEFILNKLKKFLRNYFNQNIDSFFNEDDESIIYKMNMESDEDDDDEIKYLYFVDFPGQIKDSTLGGLTTNLAYESLNLLSARGYFSIVERIIKESVFLKQFEPSLSYNVILNAFDHHGLFDYFNYPFTDQSFEAMKEELNEKKVQINSIYFNENQGLFHNSKYSFELSFSHQNVKYNYETLYEESDIFSSSKKIITLFQHAANPIISSTYVKVIGREYDFVALYSHHLTKLLHPIKKLKHYVVYNFHSNASNKTFYCKTGQCTERSDNGLNDNLDLEKSLGVSMIRSSIIFPILYWEWYGFKEWIKIEDLLSEYSNDLAKIQEYAGELSKQLKLYTYFNLSKCRDTTERIRYTMQILSREGEYVIGKSYVLMKKGTLVKMRNKLNAKIKEIIEEEAKIQREIRTIHQKASALNQILSKTNLQRNANRFKSRENTKQFSTNDNNKNSASERVITVVLPKPKESVIINEDNNNHSLLKEEFMINIIEKNQVINCRQKKSMFPCEQYDIFNYIDSNRKNLRKILISNCSSDDLIDMITNTTPISNITEHNNNTKTISTTSVFNVSNLVRRASIGTLKKQRNSIVRSSLVNFAKFELHLSQIKLLQNAVRNCLSKIKLRLLRYIKDKTIIIQKHMRNLIARKRFAKFRNCLKKIIYIQKKYRERLLKKNLSALCIQMNWTYKRKLMKMNESERILKGIEDIRRRIIHNKRTADELKQQKLIEMSIKRKSFQIQKESDLKRTIMSLLYNPVFLKENIGLTFSTINTKGIDSNIKSTMLEQYHYEKPVINRKKSMTKMILLRSNSVNMQRTSGFKVYQMNEEKNLSFHPKISQSINNNEINTKRKEIYSLYKSTNLQDFTKNQVQSETPIPIIKPYLSSYAKALKGKLCNLYNPKDPATINQDNESIGICNQTKTDDQSKKPTKQLSRTSRLSPKGNRNKKRYSKL